jgi:hypothetical protein
MRDFQALRKVLQAEQRRRAACYRFRPHERQKAMAEIAQSLAALDRLEKEERRSAQWKAVGRWWTEKYDE